MELGKFMNGEELGINLAMEDLTSLGTIQDEIIQGSMIDKEFGHVFLYFIPNEGAINYKFDIEEVTGVFKFN